MFEMLVYYTKMGTETRTFSICWQPCW